MYLSSFSEYPIFCLTKKYMKILDFSGDNTGTLNFVVKLKDAEDGD